jgi:hypothetical protein
LKNNLSQINGTTKLSKYPNPTLFGRQISQSALPLFLKFHRDLFAWREIDTDDVNEPSTKC